MELLPRITRAQSMDVLSSQANLAGYRAVIDAAADIRPRLSDDDDRRRHRSGRKVFVMGVGVAGLQAIATARAPRRGRLRHRRAAGDEGAGRSRSARNFLAVENEEFQQAADRRRLRQGNVAGISGRSRRELVASHIAKQDIVITTALIPGRPAPSSSRRRWSRSMRAGSVIVDLAAERGGNCELTKPGETVGRRRREDHGALNLAGRLAATASSLYAKNLLTFVETLVSKETKQLAVNWEDELVKATVLTRDGAVVHRAFQIAACAHIKLRGVKR